MKLKVFSALIGVLFLSPLAQAAHVIKIKDQRVLVQLDDTQVSIGQLFYVMRGTKKVSVIEITQSRDGRAIANIRAGKAFIGGVLKARVPPAVQALPSTHLSQAPAAGAGMASRSVAPARRTTPIPSPSKTEFAPDHQASKQVRTHSKYPMGKTYFGPLGGVNYTWYTLNFPNSSQAAKPKGLGYMGKLFVDHSFSRMLDNAFLNYIRLALSFGWELAKGKSDTGCEPGGSGACDGDIHYFTFDTQLYFELLQNLPVRPWLGFRYGAYYPLKLETDYFKPDEKTLTSRWGPVVGVNILLGQQIMLSVSSDFAWFPSSDQVKTKSLSARIGLGYSFQ